MNRQQTRRQFLAETAAIGVGAWIVGPSLAGAQSPNERVRIACIGVGGKGSSDTDHCALHGDVVALCDIDDKFMDAKAQQLAKNYPMVTTKKYNDFRKLFDEMENSIDAVQVSTPDHTHAAATMMALKRKKHCYTQKPLTWSVKEARLLREAAKQYGVCTQMGNQGSAGDGLRTAIEIVRSGAIGGVREVHVWTDRPGTYWIQAPDVVARPAGSDPVPPNVHWDLWLGPAAERPYIANKGTRAKDKTYHDFAWRGWRDFGTGALGDMGCHNANMTFKALGLEYPTSVVAENSEVNPETYQQWSTITYQFPARGSQPPVKLVWWEGYRDGKRNLPPEALFLGQKIELNGQLLIGDKGTMYCAHADNPVPILLPQKDFEGYKPPEPTLARTAAGRGRDVDASHKGEWIAAIKANKPELAFSNFAYAGLLTETILLGNVAIRAGKKIEWDGPGLKIASAPELSHLLAREYRKGWTV